MKISNQLLSKYFIISVLLLTLNDFYFKYYFHNFFTGKLSDFTGLFAFPFFISVFLNKKIKEVYIVVALFFVFWKSDYSQELINSCHKLNINANRVVDYTDLFALVILPFSYSYRLSKPKEEKKFKMLFPKMIVAFVTCYAFMATSKSKLQGQIKLKSNLEVKTKSTLDAVRNQLDLDKNYGDVYNCSIQIPDRNSIVFTNVILEKDINGLITIKLDSILSSETEGDFIFDSKEEDAKYVKSLKIKDFEKIFLQEKILKLY